MIVLDGPSIRKCIFSHVHRLPWRGGSLESWTRGADASVWILVVDTGSIEHADV